MLKLLAIGNLGKDCVVNTVNGKNVINFTLAHSEKFKDSQGAQQERTTWLDCAYWTDKTAIAPYLKKGQQVYIEGFPAINQYTTKDGKAGASLQVRVMQVQLVGKAPEGAAPAAAATQQQPAAASTDVADDLPF